MRDEHQFELLTGQEIGGDPEVFLVTRGRKPAGFC
ncbi:hypothetical protein QF013_000798 [Pseudomonas laurylsulfatiphila]